jgi:hypothetical protein
VRLAVLLASGGLAQAQTLESTSTPAGTRDPSQTPFASTSVFNLPLGSGARWTPNAQLSHARVFVNTVDNYNENIWVGTASDPVVTITDKATSGGTPGIHHVHVPTNAVASGGRDGTFTVDDTTTHTWYSGGGFRRTGPHTATVASFSAEPDYGSGIEDDHGNQDQGVGTLREGDLRAGTVNHMLRIEMPEFMLKSYSRTSTRHLAPNAWPQTEEDGFALNGKGGPRYTGTIPFGVTIGIPHSIAEPAGIAANPGTNLLWHALQEHGAMVRDSTDNNHGPTVVFQADQNVDPNAPVVKDIDRHGAEVMKYAQILANQGPHSVNGGGRPVVPLDPPLMDAPTR